MSVSVANTTAQLSGATLLDAASSQTVTGAKTFDRDPNPPFAVSANSAVVPNLDADKVDGYEASQLAVLAENETVSGNWTFQGTETFSGTIAGTAITLSAALTAGGAVIKSGIVSPAQITGNQNNYNPTGFLTCNRLRLNTDASRTITGFTAGTNGQEIVISNVGNFDLVLAHNSGSSSVGNKIAAANGADVTVRTNGTITMWYDGTSAFWRVDGV